MRIIPLVTAAALLAGCQATSQNLVTTSSGFGSPFKDLWMPISKTELHNIDATTVEWESNDEEFYSYLDKRWWEPHKEVMSTYYPVQWSDEPDDYCMDRLIGLRKLKTFREDAGPKGEWIENQVCLHAEMYNFYRDRDVERLQTIYDYWATQPHKKYYTGDISPPDWFDNNKLFYLGNTFTVLVTHYAYNRDQFENQEVLDAWFTKWLMDNQNPNGTDKRKCPQHEPWEYTRGKKYKYAKDWDGDSCGSLTWRHANARLALGLATKNQTLFISGVRMLEIQLSMFDTNGVFMEFGTRAYMSPTYTTEVFHGIYTAKATLDQAGVDLMEIENAHGMKVHELLTGTTEWLVDPSKNPYLRGSFHGPARYSHAWQPPKTAEEIAKYRKDTFATLDYLHFSTWWFDERYDSAIPKPTKNIWSDQWQFDNGRPMIHAFNPEQGLPAMFYLEFKEKN